MNDERQTELESRIHDLLAGCLDDAKRCDLLRQIARDDAARQMLGEMAELQWQGRSCFGLQMDATKIQSALARTLGALHAEGSDAGFKSVPMKAEGLSADPAPMPGAARRSWRPALVRIAAGLLLVVSLSVGYLVGTHRPIDQHPGPITEGKPTSQTVIPDLKPEDIGVLRKTWDQVALGSANTRPWIVMFNGTEPGEFGYQPAIANNQAKDDKGPILVRCILIAEGQPPRQLNILLSRRQSEALSVTGIGCLKSGTLDLAVSSAGGRVNVGLKVSGDRSAESGLQGTMLIDHSAVDAGRFRVDGQMLQVFFQAVTLTG